MDKESVGVILEGQLFQHCHHKELVGTEPASVICG